MTMTWVYLGHASWGVEVAGMRLLFDPLLAAHHDGGVFRMEPRRTLDLEALRPDFLLVSHRHPDHFDPESLHQLARFDADIVLLTPDPLVERTAHALGFSTVRRVPPATRIDLDRVSIVTTPSAGEPLEWGALVTADEASVWNQVDTTFGSVSTLRRVLDRALAEAGRNPGRGFELGLVRWQPLLEVATALGEGWGFPFRDYGALLSEAAAVPAKVLGLTANGVAHAEPGAWLNRHVYPVSAERFCRDLARLADVSAVAPAIGDAFSVAHGEVARLSEASPWVVQDGPGEPPLYRPQTLPALVDEPASDAELGRRRDVIDSWVRRELAEALRQHRDAVHGLRLSLEVVCADDAMHYALSCSKDGELSIRTQHEADFDQHNTIASADLAGVIEGRRHWGQALLGGRMRACCRAYDVGSAGLRRRAVPPFFLYWALPYERSFERWVESEVARLTG